MPSFTPLRYEQIMAQLIARLIARSDLSDVADSGVAKHMMAAHARALEQAYYQASLVKTAFSIDTATGSDLDSRAKDIQPGTLTRIPAQYAHGYVVLSRNVVAGATPTIAINQVLQDGDGNSYQTLAATSWDQTSVPQITGHITGQDSPPVPVAALTAGSAGNVASGSITTFLNRPQGVDAVTNVLPLTGGFDQETDDGFRARIKAFVSSLSCGTPTALESAVLGQQDSSGATILYAKAYEDISTPGYTILYIDDGTGSAATQTQIGAPGEVLTATLLGPPQGAAVGGEMSLNLKNYPVVQSDSVIITSSKRGVLSPNGDYQLLPSNGSIKLSAPLTAGEIVTAQYTYYTGLIALAQLIIDGDPTNAAQYPGVRSAGTRVDCMVPQILEQNISGYAEFSLSYSEADVKSAISVAIASYINTLGIGADVLVAEIIASAMAVPGCLNFTLTGSVIADVIVLDNQLARIGAPVNFSA